MEDVLGHFPKVDYAFAYGSAIFQQPGLYEDADGVISPRPMVDLIFAVDDPTAWHAQVRTHHSWHGWSRSSFHNHFRAIAEHSRP